MGGSALRAIAFGKPLIVLGIQGFVRPLLPSTAKEFLFNGFFGTGCGDLDPRPLAADIRQLADRPEMRSELGDFGRQLVLDRFSLMSASAKLEAVYSTAVAQTYPRCQRVREAARVVACRTGSGALPEAAKARLRTMPMVCRLAERRRNVMEIGIVEATASRSGSLSDPAHPAR